MRKNLCFACVGVILGICLTQVTLLTGASTAEQNPATGDHKRCDFTVLLDAGKVNLGQDGQIDYKDSGWKAVADGGWQLKAAHDGNWVFEKCQ